MAKRQAHIEKAALYVQIGGVTYEVRLPQERLILLAKMAGGMSDDGVLPICKSTDVTFGKEGG